MSVSTKSTNRITATEARVHFGEIYRRVTENDETIIVERNGKPGLVILPIDEYETLRQRPPDANARPAWLANMIRIGQEWSAERSDHSPVDWNRYIDEGREGDTER